VLTDKQCQHCGSGVSSNIFEFVSDLRSRARPLDDLRLRSKMSTTTAGHSSSYLQALKFKLNTDSECQCTLTNMPMKPSTEHDITFKFVWKGAHQLENFELST
jgi:hypothetical protein